MMLLTSGEVRITETQRMQLEQGVQSQDEGRLQIVIEEVNF